MYVISVKLYSKSIYIYIIQKINNKYAVSVWHGIDLVK